MYPIPPKLTSLYQHWQKHADQHGDASQNTYADHPVVIELSSFITKRMRMWDEKTRDLPSSTDDPVLSGYRFCNIYRELDRQTIAIHELLLPLRDDFALWLLNAMFVRMVCKAQTVQQVGLLSFDQHHNQKVKTALLELPRPKYGSAYVFPISIIQRSDWPRREDFFCEYLPLVAQALAEDIKTWQDLSVREGLARLLPILGFNFRFHMTEILIDVAYQYPEHLDLYRDFYIGPGALPTLKRIDPTGDPVELCTQLAQIALPANILLHYEGQPIPLSAENWEGACCEFRKYTNLSNGKGRRRRYTH